MTHSWSVLGPNRFLCRPIAAQSLPLVDPALGPTPGYGGVGSRQPMAVVLGESKQREVRTGPFLK